MSDPSLLFEFAFPSDEEMRRASKVLEEVFKDPEVLAQLDKTEAAAKAYKTEYAKVKQMVMERLLKSNH